MSDSDSNHDRESGVEFGAVADDLASHDYPATSGELVAEYGDRTLGLPDGETTVGDTLSAFEENERFESVQEVRQAIFTMVGSDAVGRKHYTDRGVGRTEDDEVRSI